MFNTFTVDDVTPSNERCSEGDVKQYVERIVKAPIEALGYSSPPPIRTAPYHPFVQAVHTAYDKHHPLILRPDDVWLVIVQGLAHHINNNAEGLRKRFVQHEGQVHIEVQRDGFVKGSPDNNWPDVFGEFSANIHSHLGKQHDLFIPDFSTTDPVSRAASEVVLMDAMQAYFSYGVSTCCGIPSITLLGQPLDWDNICTRVQMLAEYDLSWWTQALLPICQQFYRASKGDVDVEFWRNFYKLYHMSGGPFITGWINTFFPYFKNWKTGKVDMKNTQNLDWTAQQSHGTKTDQMPSGLSGAPFTWTYLGQEYKMRFSAGFVGVSQQPSDGAISPIIGWAVGDEPKPEEAPKRRGK